MNDASTDALLAASPQEYAVSLPPGVSTGESAYMAYLPGMYQRNEFLGRFLLIFEHIFAPIQRTVGNGPSYFDPAVAPPDVLAWLGSWLGLVLDERWPERTRRDLVANAAALFTWRGTRRGLAEFVRLYTGVAPEISEPTRSEIQADPSLAFTFDIRLSLPPTETVDEPLLRQVIEIEKPAWAAYRLTINQQQA